MTQAAQNQSLLQPYRVLDLCDERGFYCGQLLGNLGADVIKVEPPGGDPARRLPPFAGGTHEPDQSLLWNAYNTNKRGVTLDLKLEKDNRAFKGLVRGSDAVIESFHPGTMKELGLDYEELSRLNPGLVLVSISPFGQTGPYAAHRATDLTCWAMGGLLAQSGDPDRPPVRIGHIPFSYLMAGLDAAWAAIAALYWRASSGFGQHIDVSIQESMVKTTFLARETWDVTGGERPRGSTFYTVPFTDTRLRIVWPLKDGFLYKLFSTGAFGGRENPKLVAWLDEEGAADDFLKGIDWHNLDWRNKTQSDVNRLESYFFKFFAGKTKKEILEAALARDIVLQPVSSPADILEHPQLRARDYWRFETSTEAHSKVAYPGRFSLPTGPTHAVFKPPPRIGEHNIEVFGEKASIKHSPDRPGEIPRTALQGVKVLALEQALAGPWLASVLAAYGATVIRLETGTRPDWQRQAGPFVGNISQVDRSTPYLFVNSGKLGITLNLKLSKGIELARQLAVWSDVVVENFAGGVVGRLGLGYEDLRKLKADIIMLSTGIYGQTGPYAEVKGHGGPLTALAGFPHITGFPGQPPQFPGFVLTDFTAPRAGLVALLAALDYHRRTGAGHYVDMSQFESAVHLLSPVLLEWQVSGTLPEKMGNRSRWFAPEGVYRCAGNDRWCAISITSNSEWSELCRVTGNGRYLSDKELLEVEGRMRRHDEIDAVINGWTSVRTAEEVYDLLQKSGIPAGIVQTGDDLTRDPQLGYRKFYWALDHPAGIGQFTYSGFPARMSRTGYSIRRAPMLGEHNEYVATRILGLTDREFLDLLEQGVFE